MVKSFQMDISSSLQAFAKALNVSDFAQLQSLVLSLQSRISELEKENMELKLQIDKQKKWEKEKECYETVQLSKQASIFYRLKGTEELFCPKCFESQQEAIHVHPPLKYSTLLKSELFCPNCNTHYRHKE